MTRATRHDLKILAMAATALLIVSIVCLVAASKTRPVTRERALPGRMYA